MSTVNESVDVEEGYRIPKLEEFVQGFEFEVANDVAFVMLDTELQGQESADDVARQIKDTRKRVWTQAKVWWKHDPKERVIQQDDNGNMWNMSGATINFFKPFDEASYIKQGLVRVKI